MSPSDIEKEADAIMKEFKSQATYVLGVAYDQFPSFVKFFKRSYTDVGSNLTYCFRMWRPGSHVKNYVAWNKDMAPNFPDFDCWAIAPMECDSDEGIYPELEFRFDATNYPLYGPATLIPRIEAATVNIFDGNFAGLTTSTVASDWPKNVTLTPATFNILPLSADDMNGSKTPGFLPLVTNPPPMNPLLWPTLPRGLIGGYWILRDDGLQQTSWVKTLNTPSDVPGEPSRAPGRNPEQYSCIG
jgi:hypothetical protein